jgi:hypothetical protein
MEGSNFSMDGTVNSPVRATEKKVVVRAAATAASSGAVGVSSARILSMRVIVKGARLGVSKREVPG